MSPTATLSAVSRAQPLWEISHASLADYFALTKPRVMTLVVFSGLAGLVVAPVSLHPLLMLVALLCIAMSAGGGRRHQHVVGARHRRPDAAHGRPAPAAGARAAA